MARILVRYEHAVCTKCGHEVREHQPAYGTQRKEGGVQIVGCALCECILTITQKLRAWGGG